MSESERRTHDRMRELQDRFDKRNETLYGDAADSYRPLSDKEIQEMRILEMREKGYDI